MIATREWEQLWLPVRPLASDDLRAGIYHQSRPSALTRRYIEANPHALSNLLGVDIDHEDVLMCALWDRSPRKECPRVPPLPAVIENPTDGHAHAMWALAEPVTRADYARHNLLALAAVLVEGFRRATGGDEGYSGLITKNPTHECWDASWWTDELYTLGYLRERLEDLGTMPAPPWKRTRRRNFVGLGRNCSIFETARILLKRACPSTSALTTPRSRNAPPNKHKNQPRRSHEQQESPLAYRFAPLPFRLVPHHPGLRGRRHHRLCIRQLVGGGTGGFPAVRGPPPARTRTPATPNQDTTSKVGQRPFLRSCASHRRLRLAARWSGQARGCFLDRAGTVLGAETDCGPRS